jgi:hypothetical protein
LAKPLVLIADDVGGVYSERFEEVSWQAKIRTRKALPRQVNEVLKDAAALTKEAKGLADGIRL